MAKVRPISAVEKYQLPIPDREPDGQWESEQRWINHATQDIGGMNALCVDAANRICAIGADFARATKEGTYPVRYYYGAGGESKAQQRQSIASAKRALKDRYPWRRY